jgi:glycosyltransferase involved in cell wall biosynthesis
VKVSILIPCYNAERWIAQCIESALAQTWAEKEVIVVDDGSTDSSLAIIQQFEGRILWETGPNRGGNVARNRLLELAEGDWLQYLDADDYLLPDKVEKQAEFALAHPQVDVVFSRCVQETHGVGGSIHQATSLMPEPLDPWCLLVRWDMPQTGALLWRRSAVLHAGRWKEDQPCCQEHELYLRMLKTGARFAYCTSVGAVYRQWSTGSVCTKNPQEVHRRRVEIVDETERYLKEAQALTSERIWAISHARLEVARTVWRYDTARAGAIADSIQRSFPEYRPAGPGRRTPCGRGYDIMYRALGFRVAETVAALMRRKPLAGA